MKHLFGLTNLGSGSSGNATVIHTPEGALLVDAGFSAKELCVRLQSASIRPESIHAVLITHEHTDHTKGLRVFTDAYAIPCYVTNSVCKALAQKNRIGEKRSLITAGTPFGLLGLEVDPFTVQHDACETVAFNFRFGEHQISIATDLGQITASVCEKLRGAEALLIESNHDLKMLANSDRPIRLKRRIMSRYGHLSNKDAMESLDSILTEVSRFLLFAHLSSECNKEEIVTGMAEQRLDYLKRCDILYKVAKQSQPTDTFWVV